MTAATNVTATRRVGASTLIRTAAAALLALGIATSAQAQSSQAQLDMMQVPMIQAANALDFAGFLHHLEAFRAAGGDPDAGILYFEALAKARTGDEVRAYQLLTGIIDDIPAGTKLYLEALQLLSEVTPVAQAAERRLAGLETLLAALRRGQERVSVTPMPGPSDWARYRTENSGFSLYTAELHRGMAPLADGGWLTFGHKPLGDTPNRLPGLSDPLFPQAALERRDLAGRVLWTRAYDWTNVDYFILQPGVPNLGGLGIILHPHPTGWEILGFTPGSPAAGDALPRHRAMPGDLVTHVNGRQVSGSDNFPNLVREGGPVVRLTLQRTGTPAPIEVEIVRDTSIPSIIRHPDDNAPASGRDIVGLAGWSINASSPPTDASNAHANRRHSWNSEVIAFVPDADGDGGRICVNIDYGPWYQTLGQTGFWIPVNGQGELDGRHAWAMPLDHPHHSPQNRQWAADSGLIDCVGLPDGSMLTVGRAVRRLYQDNTVRIVESERGTLVYRIIGADGTLIAAHRVAGSGQPLREPAIREGQPAHERFQPLRNQDGWAWTHAGHILDAREGTLNVMRPNDFTPGDVRIDRQGNGVLVDGRSHILLDSGSGFIQRVEAAERMPDGTVLALLSIRLDESLRNLPAPDGRGFGAELPPAGFADGLYDGIFHTVSVLTAFGPGQSDPLWAVLLRHGQPLPGTLKGPVNRSQPDSLWADDRTHTVSWRWTNLAVLENGAIAVMTPSGAGAIIRPRAD